MPFITDKNMRLSCIAALSKLSGEIYKTKEIPYLYSPVSTHPDLQIHFVKKDTAYTSPALFDYYRAALPKYITLLKGESEVGGTYPGDAAYNIARIGKTVILNKKTADRKIAEYYEKSGYEIISVNQGYTKCNIAVGKSSVLTEDAGIYKALEERKVRVMKLDAGLAKLSGFPYGFIGGATVLFGDTLYFCGTIKNTEICDKIRDFFMKEGTKIDFLDKENLTDYGSTIFFE